jgi:hypothetical protein
MAPDTQALIRLLCDSDLETVRLVKQQLAAMVEDNPRCLDELANSDDERVSHHAREILSGVESHDAVRDFELLCLLGGENFPIEQAAWLLARAIQTDLSTASYEAQVDEWGRELLSRHTLATDDVERVRLLTDFVSEELGFRGNSACYYCEENSLLPHVIESRVGIPISLALVYMMVGSRAGLKIEGINLPGHFIARHGGVYFDPFHHGKISLSTMRSSFLPNKTSSLKKPPPPRDSPPVSPAHACQSALCLRSR